jgi:predicted metal-dependent hydrolase
MNALLDLAAFQDRLKEELKTFARGQGKAAVLKAAELAAEISATTGQRLLAYAADFVNDKLTEQGLLKLLQAEMSLLRVQAWTAFGLAQNQGERARRAALKSAQQNAATAATGVIIALVGGLKK